MYSRVPVYSGKRSNIIGMLLVHDVLAAAAQMIPEDVAVAAEASAADAGAGSGDGKYNPNSSTSAVSVRSCMYQIGSLPRFTNTTALTKCLQAFKSGAPNMGLVYSEEDAVRTTSGVIGIFTMSTLMEHVLKSRVPDEKSTRRAIGRHAEEERRHTQKLANAADSPGRRSAPPRIMARGIGFAASPDRPSPDADASGAATLVTPLLVTKSEK